MNNTTTTAKFLVKGAAGYVGRMGTSVPLTADKPFGFAYIYATQEEAQRVANAFPGTKVEEMRSNPFAKFGARR